jgi:hypothetical protein
MAGGGGAAGWGLTAGAGAAHAVNITAINTAIARDWLDRVIKAYIYCPLKIYVTELNISAARN